MKLFYTFLDNKIFPYVEKFFANPIIITITLLLLIPMVGFQNDVVLILLLNSYMNVGSFGTSQITLRQVILTAGQQEQRAQETHDTVISSNKAILLELEIARQERDELREIIQFLHEKLENGGMNDGK